MAEQGVSILKHHQELAFMGFWEVLKNLRTIQQFYKEIKEQILTFKPQKIVLVDYAGFNLKVAKWAKSKGIPVHFYIAPKTWAWNERRVHTIAKYVDKLYVIFPFEEAYFRKFGIDSHYVGNPLWVELKKHTSKQKIETIFVSKEKKKIALLPGSRKQELQAILPIMEKTATLLPEVEFMVAAISEFSQEFYKTLAPSIPIVFDKTYELLQEADAALVTSGTATLETALWEIPQVVVYKTSPITYYIAKLLIKIKFISLVNIVFGEKIVEECIQKDCNPERLKLELTKILQDESNRNVMISNYRKLKQKLDTNIPSEKLVELIIQS
ncbi:MAG: lipid-A-disaccharide synthase, partial [Leadbetterella sp.]